LTRVALAAAGFAAVAFEGALVGFTGTFDVTVMGGCLGCDFAAFFGTAEPRLPFAGVAFPGFFAAFFGFFVGIYRFRLFTKERAIIPTPSGLYRPSAQHITDI